LSEQVSRRRFADPGYADHVGHDPKWDAWFGALQAKENYAGAHGKRFGVDLMGRGPGTGFGQMKARVDGGVGINLADDNADQELATAGRQAEAHRADQQQRGDWATHTPQPYSGPFSVQGNSPEVDQAAYTPPPARRPSAPGPRVPPPARVPRSRQAKPAGGSYVTQR
jgi:hypothetical protein